MDIKKEHIAYKKTVGRVGKSQVMELGTTGGLHLVIVQKDGKPVVAGSGPHAAVARYIAQKQNPDIEYTELSKSDYMEPYLFMAIVPEYERLTKFIQNTWESK